MGALQASEMAEWADLDSALTWHLRANHFPPVPVCMLEPCKQAIEACNEGEWRRSIDLPEGVSFRGGDTATASEIVEGLHLFPWINDEDEWD